MSLRRYGRAATIAAIALFAVHLTPAGASAARAPKPSSTQWGLQAIGAPAAWSRGQGAGIVVAVLDTGADLSHPALASNLWINRDEIAGNGVDDDANGYVDDVNGYDFIAGDPVPADENGHGTHVAGIVAGDCTPLCGAAPKASLMIVRVLDGAANGTTTGVARGIRYAVDNGARIINLSLAGPSPDPDLDAAIAYANERGALIVAAAGNSHSNVDTAPVYPASTGGPNLLSVAASDPEGELSAQSSYGANSITLAAPGDTIVSAARGGGREYRTGSSMAAAMTSGALAALASAKRSAPLSTVKQALLSTARGTLPVMSGKINLDRAVDRLAGRRKASAARKRMIMPVKLKKPSRARR